MVIFIKLYNFCYTKTTFLHVFRLLFSHLQERSKEMGKPTTELLPRSAEGVPRLRSEQEGVLYVAVEDIAELASDVCVKNDGILFVVPTVGTGIKIG